jgi:tRNA dimethylallyltransferase
LIRKRARRTIRAIEVCVMTGRPFSEQRTKNPPPYHLLQLGLTMPREDLYARLDRRVDAMLEQGLLDEVRALAARGYDWRLPAMTSLGYDQLGHYLRGDSSLEQAVQQIKHDTHLFVRRQYTWFRKYTQLNWLEQPDVATVATLIQTWLHP